MIEFLTKTWPYIVLGGVCGWLSDRWWKLLISMTLVLIAANTIKS